jgi:hypothetical protein
MNLTPEQNEALRKALLIFLAKRQGIRFSLSGLIYNLNEQHTLDFTVEPSCLKQTIAFLEGYHYLMRNPSPMGASETFEVTTEGVLFYERNYI